MRVLGICPIRITLYDGHHYREIARTGFLQVTVQVFGFDEITQQLLKTPNDANLRYEAGKIMMDLGMKEEGANWLRTALKIQPWHQQAKEALAAHDETAQPASRSPK